MNKNIEYSMTEENIKSLKRTLKQVKKLDFFKEKKPETKNTKRKEVA